MKLGKYWPMMMVGASVFIQTFPAYADTAAPLPGPGVFGLVVMGITAAVAIARWRK